MPMRPTLLTSTTHQPSLAQIITRGIRSEAGAQRINRMTLSRLTGIPYKRVCRIFNDSSRMTIGDVAEIAEALCLSVVDLIAAGGAAK